MKKIITFLIAASLAVALGQEYGGGHALFVRTSSSGDGKRDTTRRVYLITIDCEGEKAIT